MTEKLNRNSQEPENANGRFSNTRLLQIGVVFLALVSFFTTANGMKAYIFTGPENSVIAYAASAAIQGILLALSMNLPGYILGIRGQDWPRPIKAIFCTLALLLTGVAVFCSSWFSYTYIATVLHAGSWETDSELLVQQTYRSELYDARDYAHAYQIYLEESVGEKILLLEEQARQLSNSSINSSINSYVNWDAEVDEYVSNGGTMASSYMATVIAAMRNAIREEPSQEELDLAVQAVSDAKENITVSLETIQQNIDRQTANITSYNTQIAALNNRINNATENTDIDALNNTINNYIQQIQSASQEQNRLNTEYTQLYNAFNRIQYYESLLGLNSSTSSISIRSRLLELQQEFFNQEPDENKLLEKAEDIFKSLRDALHTLSTGSEVENAEGAENSEDELSSTVLLLQMNQLIQNLKDYSEIKGIEAALEDLISELRTTAGNDEEEQPDVTPGPSAGIPEPPDETVEPSDEAVEPSDAAPEPSDAEQSGAPSEEEPWKTEWGNRLDHLKAQISAMPAYSGTETGTGTALTESQASLLRRYDRNRSSANLDNMIRLYITDHNAIHQGLIYLQSPYRGLAVFALLLALFFDLTGFVFGVIIQGNLHPNKTASMRHEASSCASLKSGQADWSIIKTKNCYIVLTGDYESRDGIYYYKVFKDGLLGQWPVKDTIPYQQGIYIQKPDTPTQGYLAGQTAQELIFAHQPGGPSDGIYLNCLLLFDEGSLILVQGGQTHFLASINEYVPVHSYNPNMGENQTIPAKQLATAKISVKTAIVALNAKGTRISAIYMIEQ